MTNKKNTDSSPFSFFVHVHSAQVYVRHRDLADSWSLCVFHLCNIDASIVKIWKKNVPYPIRYFFSKMELYLVLVREHDT